MSPRLQRIALTGASVVALLLAGVLAWRQGASLEETLAAAEQLPVGLLVLVFALSAVNYVLRFLRWELLIGPITGLQRRRHVAIYLAGFSLTLTPAKAGEALRTVYLLPHGVSAGHSLACLAVERVLDVLAVAAISGLVVILWPFGWAIVLPSMVGVVVFAWLLRHNQSGTALPRWLPHRMVAAAQPLQAAFRPFGLGTFIRAVPLSLLGWGLEALGLALLVHHFAPEASMWVAAGVFGAAVLGGALTFLPGGLGGTELLMVALLTAIGLSGAEAALVTAVCRLATLWFGFALGLAAVPLLGAGTAGLPGPRT
jgi:uncharacterized protein (TIRG00374 family)